MLQNLIDYLHDRFLYFRTQVFDKFNKHFNTVWVVGYGDSLENQTVS